MRRLLLIFAIVASAAIAACSPDGSPASPAIDEPAVSFEPSALPSDDLSSEMPSVEVSPEPSSTP